jgi:hypothetical protein
LRNKQDKGEYWQFDLPVDNMYYVPQRDTFTIKKILFEQITKKQEIDEET